MKNILKILLSNLVSIILDFWNVLIIWKNIPQSTQKGLAIRRHLHYFSSNKKSTLSIEIFVKVYRRDMWKKCTRKNSKLRVFVKAFVHSHVVPTCIYITYLQGTSCIIKVHEIANSRSINRMIGTTIAYLLYIVYKAAENRKIFKIVNSGVKLFKYEYFS